MNYNANAGSRPNLGRKVKRVSDVNAMGYNPYEQPNATAQPNNIYPNIQTETPNPNLVYQQDYVTQPFDQGYGGAARQPTQNYPYAPENPYIPPQMQVPQMGVFGQPVVQDMALKYGQQLADTGKTMIKQEVERYLPITKLKYYFAVDTKYVVSKLVLLLFPFTHKDWSVKYEQKGPVQPRFEINAPDLYIPTMAYVTFIVAASLVLGTQQRFSPEQIGILASSALAWCVLEVVVCSLTSYIVNIQTSLRYLDLVAYSGYKFVGIIISILLSLVGGKKAYYFSLIYVNLALAFFLIRTLKTQVLSESSQETSGYYGDVAHSVGNKRRLYFLLFVAGIQPVLAWWLSFHLIGYSVKSEDAVA